MSKLFEFCGGHTGHGDDILVLWFKYGYPRFSLKFKRSTCNNIIIQCDRHIRSFSRLFEFLYDSLDLTTVIDCKVGSVYFSEIIVDDSKLVMELAASLHRLLYGTQREISNRFEYHDTDNGIVKSIGPGNTIVSKPMVSLKNFDKGLFDKNLKQAMNSIYGAKEQQYARRDNITTAEIGNAFIDGLMGYANDDDTYPEIIARHMECGDAINKGIEEGISDRNDRIGSAATAMYNTIINNQKYGKEWNVMPLEYNKFYNKTNRPEINEVKVVTNKKGMFTTILWNDGGFTTVKLFKNDAPDIEKAVALCVAKRFLGMDFKKVFNNIDYGNKEYHKAIKHADSIKGGFKSKIKVTVYKRGVKCVNK